MYDIFHERGNLEVIFSPRDTELTPLTNHIEFKQEDLEGLNAVVVEIQDVGSRYFNYTKDVFRLMDALKAAGTEELFVCLNTASSPCVLKAADGGDSFTYMILPVRIKNG